MKSFAAILSIFAATTVLAVPIVTTIPTTASVNINISNDQSGLNGVATIPIDGLDHKIVKAFADTGLATAAYQASSAQLNAFPQTPFSCVFKTKKGGFLGYLDAQLTYTEFDGIADVLTVVNLKGATINCST
jgi:hypothetical protein